MKGIVDEQFQSRIKFVGKRHDVESIVNIFDIGVLSSYNEGLSNAVMEYMALGKAIVVTSTGAPIELIPDRRYGILLEPGDILGLANSIDDLLQDERLRVLMGSNAKARLRESFDFSTMCNEYMRLYLQILKVK